VTDSYLGFSLGGFAIAVVAVAIGAVAGLSLVPVAGSFLGVLVGGVVAGLVTEKRPLLEAGVAGSLASLGIVMAGGVIGNGATAGVAALGAVAPTTLLISVALSFAVGAFGAHFGDDLREGLTAPVDTSPSRGRDSVTQSSTATESAVGRDRDEPVDRDSLEDDTEHLERASTRSREDIELERE